VATGDVPGRASIRRSAPDLDVVIMQAVYCGALAYCHTKRSFPGLGNVCWGAFEPNDESLWAQIRLNADAFMNNLFQQSTFQGHSSREAYFVRCDKDTTTQNDIDIGVVTILIGFAPLKSAEFVVLKIQQGAGQYAA